MINTSNECSSASERFLRIFLFQFQHFYFRKPNIITFENNGSTDFGNFGQNT